MGRYLIAKVETYSSEGNTYCIAGDYDSKPTYEQLRAKAERDWNNYCEGIYPNDEKNERIEKFLSSYIVVDRELLYPLYAVTSWSMEDGDVTKYFLTAEEARAEVEKQPEDIKYLTTETKLYGGHSHTEYYDVGDLGADMEL